MGKTYDTYKDSGIPWIGNIPSGWLIFKTLYALDMPITDGPHETPKLYDSGIPFISAEAVSDGKIDFSHIRGYISESFYRECCKKYVPQRKDIYMVKSGATTGKTAMVDTDEIFTIWSPLAVFRANPKVMNPYFLLYALQSNYYFKQVELNWSYGTQQNIGMRILEKLRLCVPPLLEQQAIASYLDEKCADIDAIISLQEEMISELQAYKQSIITEAVTKGLDPNVPMKDSGIEWIGEIPIQWTTIRFKQLFKTRAGINFSKSQLVTEGERVISYGQIHSKNNYFTSVNPCLIKYIPNTFIKDNDITLACKGDFIFADTSEDIEGCGNFVCIDTSKPIYAGYHTFLAMKCNHEYDKYLAYLFMSWKWRSQIRSKVNGIKVFSITQSIVNSVYIILPPISEQKAIASYLDEKCADIDAIISLRKKKIEDLKEYKKSVIFEAVTGKIKVV